MWKLTVHRNRQCMALRNMSHKQYIQSLLVKLQVPTPSGLLSFLKGITNAGVFSAYPVSVDSAH